MASLKPVKSVGTQLFGQVKKEPATKTGDGASKAPATKQTPKKPAPKKAKGGKSSKH